MIESTLDLATMWRSIVGAILPGIIAVINQPTWGKFTKYWLAWTICMILAGIEVYFNGQFDLKNLAGTMIRTVYIVVGSYVVFWKPSGLSDVIETMTSPRPDRKPGEFSFLGWKIKVEKGDESTPPVVPSVIVAPPQPVAPPPPPPSTPA